MSWLKDRLPANRDRVQGRSVKRIPHRQRLEPTGGHAGELQGNADGACTPRREQHFVKRARCKLRQLSCQLDGRDVRVPARAEWQGFHLLADCLDHVWVSKAYLVHTVAVKVEESFALQVFQPGALAASQHIKTRGGERLMQKILRVLLQPIFRVLVKLFLVPRLPARRDVEFTFRTQPVKVGAFHCRIPPRLLTLQARKYFLWRSGRRRCRNGCSS